MNSIKYATVIMAFLPSCSLRFPYKNPTIVLPQSYSVQLGNATNGTVQFWWKVFNDPILEDLIDQVKHDNIDLKISLEKIVESRNIYRIDAANLLPEIDFFSTLLAGNLGDGILTKGRLYNDIGASIIALDTLWEIDLWGRLYRTQKAARYRWEGQIEDMRDVLIMLIAEIAQTYVSLCSVHLKIKLLEQTRLLNIALLTFNKDSFTAGIDPEQVSFQQSTLVDAIKTNILELQIDERKLFNKIAFLLGKNPDQFTFDLEKICRIPSICYEPPVDEPYALLRRRPDIRKSEKLLRASYEEIGAAVAQWFPKISLLGFLGRPSISSSQLPPGESKLWAIGPLFNWPILDFGRIYFNIKVQESSQRQALLQYEKTVLNAIQEVENWLFSYVNNKERLAILGDKIKAEKSSYVLSKDLFLSGLASAVDKNSAHIKVNQIIYEMLNTQEALSLSFIYLYKALGGGW